MALQGTIKDFGLGDIFQLIGIQRKTGILTLDNGKEAVTVKFLEGQVVGADTRSESVEDLLGAVLVRTGRVTESQLQRALRIQKNTLQRLGYVLVKERFISDEDLIEALRVQSLQIVYRLFRWRSGRYDFRTSDDLDYDEKHFIPISAETILMEGARMIDEWPIIERRIKSDGMVFRKTEAASHLEIGVESIVDADLEFEFFDQPEGAGPERQEKKKDLSLSPEEGAILALVDGERTVTQINDHSVLGEFDTYRILADLMTRNLIEEIKRNTAADAAQRDWRFAERLFRLALHLVVFGFAIVSLATLSGNPLTPWRLMAQDDSTARLRDFGSQERLERIEKAVQVFYLDTGSFPNVLPLLARGGYLREEDLLDPWGREFGYGLFSGGYRVFAVDANGHPDEDLTLSHRFTAVQRMMQEPQAAP